VPLFLSATRNIPGIRKLFRLENILHIRVEKPMIMPGYSNRFISILGIREDAAIDLPRWLNSLVLVLATRDTPQSKLLIFSHRTQRSKIVEVFYAY
jgi:hypothetical protein